MRTRTSPIVTTVALTTIVLTIPSPILRAFRLGRSFINVLELNAFLTSIPVNLEKRENGGDPS